ncbi:glycosyltransferase family 4 protein [Paraburkholderia sediminicola]|uniref:glycosyltransferase family 4 protein n=1 Tax=Paraburkholderia sediminicola TaxID=458836 RepID=UPI0038BD096F
MKIIFLVSSMGSGGAERVAATLANAWTERGDDVTLIATFSSRGPCFYSLSDKVRFIHLADIVSRQGRGPLQYLARIKRLRSLIRHSDADVVVSFLTNVNAMAIIASFGLKVPVVVCEHNTPSADGRSMLWKLVCRFLYPKASLLTVLTEGIAASFKKMVPAAKHIAVVPNPLPDELFSNSYPPADRGSRKRIVSVGRLNRQKQFDVLINAFATLAPRIEDVDLWIWGEGDQRAALEAQVLRLGMTDRIFLPGNTPTPWSEMARARAFAVSSRFEGLPMALMESMALGVPCVSFDCPSGPRELTQDGRDGLLVAPGDADALSDAMSRLLLDDALCEEIGRRAAISIRERYGLHAVLPKWDQIFSHVEKI